MNPIRHTLHAASLAAVFSLAAAGVLAAPAQAATLELQVDNVQSRDGMLMIALYNAADSYRKTPFRAVSLPAATPAHVSFGDLPDGDYAIAMYQDRNNNGKLDTNLVGIPSEPYGFSGHATMGPPSWDDAKFSVPAAGARVTVTLSN